MANWLDMAEQFQSSHQNKIEVERRLLSALCQGKLDTKTRGVVLQRLAKHQFLDPEHEAVFLALSRLGTGTAEDIRQALGTGITRLGFPDYDLAPFFSTPAPDGEHLSALLSQL